MTRPGPGPADVGLKLQQRQPGIIRRQQLAPAGETRQLLEMEIGNKQRFFGAPVKSAGRQGLEVLTGEMDCRRRRLLLGNRIEHDIGHQLNAIA